MTCDRDAKAGGRIRGDGSINAPPPLAGGGWGEGAAPGPLPPPPNPLPQGEGEIELNSGPNLKPRIALLGFSIECNRFAPVATEHDFAARTLLRGDAMLTDARSSAPHMLGELPGFIADMDAAGTWEPVPILLAMAEPNGPVDQAFFDRMMSGMGGRPAQRRAPRRRLLHSARCRPDDG